MIRARIQRQKPSSTKAVSFDSALEGMFGFYLNHDAFSRLMTGGGRR
jgi:hypothetical protein